MPHLTKTCDSKFRSAELHGGGRGGAEGLARKLARWRGSSLGTAFRAAWPALPPRVMKTVVCPENTMGL